MRKEPITREAVEHTARLSMLALNPEELERMTFEFSAMVDFAGRLSAGREALEEPEEAGAEPAAPRLREDTAGESLSAQQALMNAKTTAGPYITVPRTFEREG